MLNTKDLVFGKEISRLICQFIYHQWSSIYQCNQIMIAHFDKNSLGCECQSSSTIQGTSRETESRRSKTGRSRRSQGMEGGKILNKRKVRGVVKHLVW